MAINNYRAVGRTCAVDMAWFDCLGVGRRAALVGLQTCFGIRPKQRSILWEALSLVGTGVFNRRVSESLAPAEVDCSSLMVHLFARVGIDIPRLAIDQRDFGEPVGMGSLLPGDLVFTSGPYSYYENDPDDDVGHVGLVTGRGIVIHAINAEPAIRKDDFSAFFDDERRSRGAVRILPPADRLMTLELPENSEIRWSRELVRLLSTKAHMLHKLKLPEDKLVPVQPPCD